MATAKKSIKKVSKPPDAHSQQRTGDHRARSERVPGSDPPVTMERRGGGRDRRGSEDRRKRNEPVPFERRAVQRRAKVIRRRQIDPTTCERDYSVDEIEFMAALDEYKRTSGRMFPTCSEILEVLRKLGYEKRTAPAAAPAAPETHHSPPRAVS